MSIRIFQVDAFTVGQGSQPASLSGQPASCSGQPASCSGQPAAFRGNPAAVCFLAAPAGERWMQLLAREMNLAETAFLAPLSDGYSLRWFTPTVEVDLCGHATLAAAHVLFTEMKARKGETNLLRFKTRSGLLSAQRQGGWIELDFPAEPARPADPPAGLIDALGVEALFVGANRLDYLVETASAAEIRGLKPDMDYLATLKTRGVMVTSRSDDPNYDFISRFFAPGAGIPEDPVTGSAHCCLGPYWQQKLGKSEMIAFQASARGGLLRVIPKGERVLLQGRAVTILRGSLSEPAASEPPDPVC